MYKNPTQIIMKERHSSLLEQVVNALLSVFDAAIEAGIERRMICVSRLLVVPYFQGTKWILNSIAKLNFNPIGHAKPCQSMHILSYRSWASKGLLPTVASHCDTPSTVNGLIN
jgi:hypothetical protein